MLNLIEFQLKTDINVTMTLDYFRAIIMPLSQLQKLTIDIENWFDDDQECLKEIDITMLINECIPKLRHFYCSIQTMHNIDMHSTVLSKHWSLTCNQTSSRSRKHLYTIPWSSEQLKLSMLAEDDTERICPNVQSLTVDVYCANLSRRFPNVRTLVNLPESNFSREELVGFRRLRHLKTDNIELVPSPLSRHIHTLTLFKPFNVLNNSIIYPNVRHFIFEHNEIDSLAPITALVQYFPNLYSVKIQFKSNTEYYDCLNILLDGKHLPNLLFFKTNRLDECPYSTDNRVWISANTPLKWKSTPYYGHCDGKYLTICL